MTITRTIAGDPIAQKRHRHRNAGSFVQTYDPSSREKHHFLAKVLAEGAPPVLEGPLRMECTFTFARPKSHLRANGELRKNAPAAKTSKPDLDNLVKFLKDALNKVAFADDSQIISLRAFKTYGEPGTTFTIEQL